MNKQLNFSERFTATWQNPTAHKLGELLADDIVLYQPHMTPIKGKQAAVQEFERLLNWLPGTHSVVKCWREDEEIALIEHELNFPFGNKCIKLPAVDRFILADGLARERVVYFDQVRLITAVLKHPSKWKGYFDYRFGGTSTNQTMAKVEFNSE